MPHEVLDKMPHFLVVFVFLPPTDILLHICVYPSTLLDHGGNKYPILSLQFIMWSTFWIVKGMIIMPPGHQLPFLMLKVDHKVGGD